MDTLLLTRFGFVALCAAAVSWAIWDFARLTRTVKAFFLEPTAPINLGILRAVTFGTLLLDTVMTQSVLYAALPEDFRSLPQGWSWLGEMVPITPGVVAWVQRVLVVTAALAMLGLFTRPMSICAALLGVYFLGIPNFYTFKIGHGCHSTVLWSLILAASHSGDAFSLDALIRRRRGQPAFGDDVAYTIPVRFCWLVLGTTYLFPGLWKLWDTGDLWINGVKLQVELYKKWATLPDFFPLVRLDHQPVLLALLGTFTLVVEVGFIFALFTRKLRIAAAVATASFHIGIFLNLYIWFHPIHPLMLLLDRRSKKPVESVAPPPPARRIGGPVVVGSILLFTQFIVGFAPVDSWPVAVFPRFSTRQTKGPGSGFVLHYKIMSETGLERELAPLNELQERVMYQTVRELSRRGKERAKKYYALAADLVRKSEGPFKPGSRLMIYRHDFLVDPDERRKEGRELSLIAEEDL